MTNQSFYCTFPMGKLRIVCYDLAQHVHTSNAFSLGKNIHNELYCMCSCFISRA